ncbi:MAG TPA: lysophospholipid acyltransferase family protein, partial [Ilumatobacteraceae bacterium]|nr:lysophospholipid acyltransferase family protein [Ilumatobacteraceae bacterium]
RLRRRLPTVRLLLFALGWSWLESASVLLAFGLWLCGQSRNRKVHYRLQAWWAANVLGLLRATTGVRIAAEGVDQLTPGPVVLLCRHASLADSLVSAWVVTSLAGLHPRYVLKRELLADPCLDIVGNRLPNHFLDRQATDSRPELDALTRLSTGMGRDDVAVIFPEGTRASPIKRERALQRLKERDPARAARLAGLQHLLPPRPAGSAALIDGAPDADIVIGWHVGFDGLDTFGGILRHLARRPPAVRFRVRRIPRAEVPSGPAFADWLDQVWLQADRDVHEMLEQAS